MNRRDFIKNMAVSAGSISPLLKMGGGLSLFTANLLASTSTTPTDGFKAIVIIHLDGGNDAMNTFPPTSTQTNDNSELSVYDVYKEIRRNLGVENVDLSLSEFYKHDAKGHYVVGEVDGGGTLGKGDEQPFWPDDGVALGGEGNMQEQYIVGSYHTKDPQGDSTGIGIHAYMPELAKLYDNKKLSIVSNVGVLTQPIEKGVTAYSAYPPFLFSHLHQYKATAYLSSDPLGKTGWAGRLADEWKTEGDVFGLNLSFSNGNAIAAGIKTDVLRLSGDGMPGYQVGNEYLMSVAEDTDEVNNLRRVYNNKLASTASVMDTINGTWTKAKNFSTFTAKNAYGKNLFDDGGDGATDVTAAHKVDLGLRTHHGLTTGMFTTLSNTAKMIDLCKNDLGRKRQIFNVSESGYDFHGGHVESHTKKLRALSMGVSDLYKALEEMGIEKEVLVVLSSEFGRTLKSNEDGTDHGWGGHSFILCGDPAFNGGNVFGNVMTDLRLDGVNAHTNRARIIPTTSLEQMLAPALKWFGVDDTTMAKVLPNLVNFRTDAGDAESAHIQGMFS